MITMISVDISFSIELRPRVKFAKLPSTFHGLGVETGTYNAVTGHAVHVAATLPTICTCLIGSAFRSACSCSHDCVSYCANNTDTTVSTKILCFGFLDHRIVVCVRSKTNLMGPPVLLNVFRTNDNMVRSERKKKQKKTTQPNRTATSNTRRGVDGRPRA